MVLSDNSIIVIVSACVIGIATLAFFTTKNNNPVINQEVSPVAVPVSDPSPPVRDLGDEYRNQLNIMNGRVVNRGGMRSVNKKKTSKKSRTKRKKRK